MKAIAGMATANEGDLREMVDNWKKLQEEQSKSGESIADLQKHFTEQMDALQGELKADIKEMDLGEEAKQSGRATIQSYIDGAQGMLPTVEAAYSAIGASAIIALYKSNPSRKPDNMARYASGTDSAEAGLALVGEQGPELVVMRGGETVMNAHETGAVLRGDTGAAITGPLVSINITTTRS